MADMTKYDVYANSVSMKLLPSHYQVDDSSMKQMEQIEQMFQNTGGSQ